MSPPTEDDGKPQLNRKTLEKDGIAFKEGISKIGSLPEWVQPICETILRTQKKIPNDEKQTILKQYKEFERSGYEAETAHEELWDLMPLDDEGGYYESKESFNTKDHPDATKDRKELSRCLKISALARKLRESQVMEPEWVRQIHSKIFRSYDQMNRKQDEYRDLFEKWEVHGEVIWNERHKSSRTRPKPDLTYAFRIFDTSQKVLEKYRFDEYVINFSRDVLGSPQVSPEGDKRPSPMLRPRKEAPTTRSTLRGVDLMCFPWAIVEVKTTPCEGTNKRIFCYCQAANASAEALLLREELAERAGTQGKAALIIFSFTCVGPSVRLWITYRSRIGRCVRMRCIWATSLELPWGVFALRRKIDSVREWAYSRARPEISNWISICRALKPTTHLTPDGDTVELRPRAASTGHRVENSQTVPSKSPRDTGSSPALHPRKTAPGYVTANSSRTRAPKTCDKRRSAVEDSEDQPSDSDHSNSQDSNASEDESETTPRNARDKTSKSGKKISHPKVVVSRPSKAQLSPRSQAEAEKHEKTCSCDPCFLKRCKESRGRLYDQSMAIRFAEQN